MLRGTAIDILDETPAACAVDTAASTLIDNIDSHARHATGCLLDMQVEPSNGQWSCIFCGHRNDPVGALATQAVQVKATGAQLTSHSPMRGHKGPSSCFPLCNRT